MFLPKNSLFKIFAFLAFIQLDLWAKVSIESANDDLSEAELIFTLPQYEFHEIEVDGKSCQALNIFTDYTFNNIEGEPALPYEVAQIQTQWSKYKVEIIEEETETQELNCLLPSLGAISSDELWDTSYSFGNIYRQNAFFPAQNLEQSLPYLYHNKQRINFTFHPIQYNPVSKQIKIVKSVHIRITALGDT